MAQNMYFVKFYPHEIIFLFIEGSLSCFNVKIFVLFLKKNASHSTAIDGINADWNNIKAAWVWVCDAQPSPFASLCPHHLLDFSNAFATDKKPIYFICPLSCCIISWKFCLYGVSSRYLLLMLNAWSTFPTNPTIHVNNLLPVCYQVSHLDVFWCCVCISRVFLWAHFLERWSWSLRRLGCHSLGYHYLLRCIKR